MEDILANTEGRSMRMFLRSVGEDVGCTEIKTHEVELILEKNPLWILQMKKVRDSHGSQEWKKRKS